MTRKILFAAAALTLLSACSSDDSPIDNTEQRVAVKLAYTTVDATETRAAQNLNEGTFATGEAVTVRISNTGADAWTDYTFNTAAEGAMTAPNPAPYYPAGSQNIDIAAYYPATAGSTFTVADDQTADASYKASDLMFASVTNQAKQAEAVNLAFTHKMTKLALNITAGQGVTSITSVSILNVKPTVSFNQATGTVGSASGDVATIAVSNEGTAVIPAQTIDGGLLSIVTDKGTATYSANKAFKAGQLYTLNITVNLRAVGTTTAITGWTSEGTVTVNPVLRDTTPDGVETIDMGNGLKWANMNVGATTVTDYGDYFAWGATVPYYATHDAYGNKIIGQWIDGKSSYNWENYTFMRSGYSDYKYITKYSIADGQTYGIWYSSGYWSGSDWYEGTFRGDNGDGVEHRNFASYDYVDDPARQNWGGNWRTPTDAEWTWLREHCSWAWTNNYNGTGIKGRIVTSNENGNVIFLPAAGYRVDTDLKYVGDYGHYWSSSLSDNYTDNATYVEFDSNNVQRQSIARYWGHTIRPVME